MICFIYARFFAKPSNIMKYKEGGYTSHFVEGRHTFAPHPALWQRGFGENKKLFRKFPPVYSATSFLPPKIQANSPRIPVQNIHVYLQPRSWNCNPRIGSSSPTADLDRYLKRNHSLISHTGTGRHI